MGVSESEEGLQKLIEVVHGYCRKWRLRANVNKTVVMVFSKKPVKCQCKWGHQALPVVSSYSTWVLILLAMELGVGM